MGWGCGWGVGRAARGEGFPDEVGGRRPRGEPRGTCCRLCPSPSSGWAPNPPGASGPPQRPNFGSRSVASCAAAAVASGDIQCGTKTQAGWPAPPCRGLLRGFPSGGWLAARPSAAAAASAERARHFLSPSSLTRRRHHPPPVSSNAQRRAPASPRSPCLLREKVRQKGPRRAARPAEPAGTFLWVPPGGRAGERLSWGEAAQAGRPVPGKPRGASARADVPACARVSGSGRVGVLARASPLPPSLRVQRSLQPGLRRSIFAVMRSPI